MQKKRVKFHGSVLAVSDSSGNMLLSEYDGTYPVGTFRGCHTFIGGIANADTSAYHTLHRELGEELMFHEKRHDHLPVRQEASMEAPKKKPYAAEKVREMVYRDIFRAPTLSDTYIVTTNDGTDNFVYLCTAYVSHVHDLSYVRQILEECEIRNEGITRVLSERDAAAASFAWGQGAVMRDVFGICAADIYPA